MNWAIFFTGIWILILVVLSTYNFWINSPETLDANELGDFIAGAMAPLAVFWLVMVYLQQRKEMKDQVAQTERIAIETQNQVSIMDSQFKKQYEPLFVYVDYKKEFTGTAMRVNIFAENTGAIATNLEGEYGNHNTKQLRFQNFDTAPEGRTGIPRNVNFRDATFVRKERGFLILLSVGEREFDKILQIEIHYTDSLGRRFIQDCQIIIRKDAIDIGRNFFKGRPRMVT